MAEHGTSNILPPLLASVVTGEKQPPSTAFQDHSLPVPFPASLRRSASGKAFQAPPDSVPGVAHRAESCNPAMNKKGTEDLYSLYEKIGNSCQDLSFRDFCGQAPVAVQMTTEENSRSFEPMASSLDFTEALAAIQSAVPMRDLPGTKAMETAGGMNALKGSERVHSKESLKEIGTLENVPRQSSSGSRKALSREGSRREAGSRRKTSKEQPSTRISGKENAQIGAAKPPGGAPHTNYCCMCNKYVFFFKTRCLVCGKCYCSQCVKEGMGNMLEGRKCKTCLGRRFSERYVERAGTGCFGVSNVAKKAEFKWAKKRSNSDRRSATVSKSSTATLHNAITTPPRSPRSSFGDMEGRQPQLF